MRSCRTPFRVLAITCLQTGQDDSYLPVSRVAKLASLYLSACYACAAQALFGGTSHVCDLAVVSGTVVNPPRPLRGPCLSGFKMTAERVHQSVIYRQTILAF